MTAPEPDLACLIREWQAGSPDALAELFARYSDHIRLVVRRRLHERLRPQFDSLDFVQDVWASVAALPPGRCEFASPDALLGFLVRVASNKVCDATRHRFRQRRDVTREEPLGQTPADHDAAAVDRGPTPSQWLIGQEQWERIVGQFQPGHRAILARLREGYTHEEIARMAGVSVRTVERIVHRLRDLCES